MNETPWWITAITWFFIILIAGWIFGPKKYEGQTAEEWFNEYDDAESRVVELESRIEEYQYALEEANDNIEVANNTIRAVQYSSDYYELGDAIDNLNTVDTVSEP